MDVMVDELPGVFGDVLDHAPGCELDDALDDAASWWVDSVPDAVPESGPEDADDLLDRLVALERRRSQLAAMEADLLVRLAGQDVQHRQVSVLDPVSDAERLLDIADEVREEIAAGHLGRCTTSWLPRGFWSGRCAAPSTPSLPG